MPQNVKQFILCYAKELMEQHGVLPGDFFDQNLKEFLLVLAADERDGERALSKAEIDESGF